MPPPTRLTAMMVMAHGWWGMGRGGGVQEATPVVEGHQVEIVPPAGGALREQRSFAASAARVAEAEGYFRLVCVWVASRAISRNSFVLQKDRCGCDIDA